METDPVCLTSSSSDEPEPEPEPAPAKGLPTECGCGAPPEVATETHYQRRGDRYLCCFYDINEAKNGCGLKKYLEETFLEEFLEIKKNKTETEILLGEANVKINDLKIQVRSLERRYEEMQAKYEEMLQKFRFLTRKNL